MNRSSTPPPAAATLLLPLLLAGCATAAALADPPLAQLARWRGADRARIAAEPVAAPCPAENPACPRLHALRAEACLGEALAARAPGAACPASAAAALLGCAAEHYASALGRERPAGAARSTASAGPAGVEAAENAPPEPSALHGARAALLLARLGPAPRRCHAARRAPALSAAAPAAHRARLRADAILHLRTCEAPPR